mmetsp:Transcript_6836/g.12992  ORF Transcript_6836/g.12992 Transcript_6836/m.12992 type:complete len:253 (-) Transcript_6836:512-1270(-)
MAERNCSCLCSASSSSCFAPAPRVAPAASTCCTAALNSCISARMVSCTRRMSRIGGRDPPSTPTLARESLPSAGPAGGDMTSWAASSARASGGAIPAPAFFSRYDLAESTRSWRSCSRCALGCGTSQMCTRDCSSRSDTSVCSKETMACTSSGSMADSAHCITGPTRPTGMEHSNCHSISACSLTEKCERSSGNTCSSSLSRCWHKAICAASHVRHSARMVARFPSPEASSASNKSRSTWRKSSSSASCSRL